MYVVFQTNRRGPPTWMAFLKLRNVQFRQLLLSSTTLLLIILELIIIILILVSEDNDENKFE